MNSMSAFAIAVAAINPGSTSPIQNSNRFFPPEFNGWESDEIQILSSPMSDDETDAVMAMLAQRSASLPSYSKAQSSRFSSDAEIEEDKELSGTHSSSAATLSRSKSASASLSGPSSKKSDRDTQSNSASEDEDTDAVLSRLAARSSNASLSRSQSAISIPLGGSASAKISKVADQESSESRPFRTRSKSVSFAREVIESNEDGNGDSVSDSAAISKDVLDPENEKDTIDVLARLAARTSSLQDPLSRSKSVGAALETKDKPDEKTDEDTDDVLARLAARTAAAPLPLSRSKSVGAALEKPNTNFPNERDIPSAMAGALSRSKSVVYSQKAIPAETGPQTITRRKSIAANDPRMPIASPGPKENLAAGTARRRAVTAPAKGGPLVTRVKSASSVKEEKPTATTRRTSSDSTNDGRIIQNRRARSNLGPARPISEPLRRTTSPPKAKQDSKKIAHTKRNPEAELHPFSSVGIPQTRMQSESNDWHRTATDFSQLTNVNWQPIAMWRTAADDFEEGDGDRRRHFVPFRRRGWTDWGDDWSSTRSEGEVDASDLSPDLHFAEKQIELSILQLILSQLSDSLIRDHVTSDLTLAPAPTRWEFHRAESPVKTATQPRPVSARTPKRYSSLTMSAERAYDEQISRPIQAAPNQKFDWLLCGLCDVIADLKQECTSLVGIRAQPELVHAIVEDSLREMLEDDAIRKMVRQKVSEQVAKFADVRIST